MLFVATNTVSGNLGFIGWSLWMQATRTRSADNVKEEKHWSQKCNMNWKTWKEAWWILTALCLDRGNKNLAWNGVQWWNGPGRDHRSGIILKQECVHMRACLNKWGVGEMTLINRREQASSLKTLGMWKTCSDPKHTATITEKQWCCFKIYTYFFIA